MKKVFLTSFLGISLGLFAIVSNSFAQILPTDVPLPLHFAEMYDGVVIQADEAVILCLGSGDPCGEIRVVYNGTTYTAEGGEFNKDKYPKGYTILTID